MEMLTKLESLFLQKIYRICLLGQQPTQIVGHFMLFYSGRRRPYTQFIDYS
jgi:hypothetical protein